MVTVCYDYLNVICVSEKGMRGQGNTPTIIAATKTKAAQNTKALIERVKPIWMPPEQVVSSVLYAASATHKVRKHISEKVKIRNICLTRNRKFAATNRFKLLRH